MNGMQKGIRQRKSSGLIHFRTASPRSNLLATNRRNRSWSDPKSMSMSSTAMSSRYGPGTLTASFARRSNNPIQVAVAITVMIGKRDLRAHFYSGIFQAFEKLSGLRDSGKGNTPAPGKQARFEGRQTRKPNAARPMPAGKHGFIGEKIFD